MIRRLRGPILAPGMLIPRGRIWHNFSTTTGQRTQEHDGTQRDRKTSYIVVLALTAVGCAGLSLLKYADKDRNFVDISYNLKKRMYDDRANKNYPVQAWPNIEYALTVLYGFDIISHLTLTLNSLKFVNKSLNEESPAELIGEANELESHVKSALSLLSTYLTEKALLSNGAQSALKSLQGASQSEDHINWEAIDEKFSDVDWVHEKPHESFVTPEAKENFIARTKRLYYKANILERKVEKYLTGKI